MNKECKRLVEGIRFGRGPFYVIGSTDARHDLSGDELVRFTLSSFKNALCVDAQVAFDAYDATPECRVDNPNDFPKCNSPWRKCIVVGSTAKPGERKLATALMVEWFDMREESDRSIIVRFLTNAEGVLSASIRNWIDSIDGLYVAAVASAIYEDCSIKVADAIALVPVCRDGTPRTDVAAVGSYAHEQNKKGAFGWSFAHLALFTFAMANCKNVVAADETAKRHLPRGQRKGNDPRYTYKVLKITDAKGVPHTGECDGEAGKAMHLCRGHFAHYSEDKPLFGRYTGTFWRPMHVRGNVKNGVVDKDYSL